MNMIFSEDDYFRQVANKWAQEIAAGMAHIAEKNVKTGNNINNPYKNRFKPLLFS